MADSISVPLLQPGITGEETACVDVHKAGGHGDRRTGRCKSWGRGRSEAESTGAASICWHRIRGLAHRKGCAHDQLICGLDRQIGQIAGKQESFKYRQEDKGTDGHKCLHNGDGLPHSSSEFRFSKPEERSQAEGTPPLLWNSQSCTVCVGPVRVCC